MTKLAYFETASLLTLAGALFVPILLIVFRQHFFLAFISSWLLLIANHMATVAGSHARAGPHPLDTTEIGLVIFSGWIPALAICGPIWSARWLWTRLKRARSQPHMN